MAGAVALIPARSGSERVPGKNVRALAGHPLVAYAIAGAFESGVFDAVIVSTDSPEIADVARRYGADVPFLRPPALARPISPDIDWVTHALDRLAEVDRSWDRFALLRPTSPFRSPDSIRAAHQRLVGDERADSIRAVRLCREHPGKMWLLDGDRPMRPLLDQPAGEVPLHSRQYAALPEVYVQDSSLEIARTRAVREHGSIAGEVVLPWHSPGVEGFSIDYPDDWDRAETMIAAGDAQLPRVEAVAPATSG